MTLDPADIKAIATEVVRQLRQTEATQMDQAHIARLPLKEQKAISREQWRQEVAEQKRKGGL